MIAIKTLLLNRFWSFLHSNILRQDETLWLNCSQFIDDLLRGVSISLKYTAVPARGGGRHPEFQLCFRCSSEARHSDSPASCSRCAASVLRASCCRWKPPEGCNPPPTPPHIPPLMDAHEAPRACSHGNHLHLLSGPQRSPMS